MKTKYFLILIVFIFSCRPVKTVKAGYCKRSKCKIRTSIETIFIKDCKESKDINHKKWLLNKFNQELEKELNVNFAEEIGLHCDNESRIYASFEISKKGILKNIRVKAARFEIKNKTIQILKNISGIKPNTNNTSKNDEFKIKITYKSHILGWFNSK